MNPAKISTHTVSWVMIIITCIEDSGHKCYKQNV